MFNNLTVKSRLIFLIAMLSVLLIGVGSIGLYGINQANKGLETVYKDRTQPAIDLATINDIWEVVRKNTAAAVESMQDQARMLLQAVSVFRLSHGMSSTTPVTRNTRSAAVASLPDRGPATRKTASGTDSNKIVPGLKKVAAGGDTWETF